jgi:glucosamine--fructose-6-phosphate aminotransferase (isomerizing)
MCGIFGYLGPRESYATILKGLKRMEYRGYDSAGIALLDGEIRVYKQAGKVHELEASIYPPPHHIHIGIGHTRWATHGVPNDINAHPHLSVSGKLALVHNGIIENYDTLKKDLLRKGYHFKSETDSEVLVNFIEDVQRCNQTSLEEAIRLALPKVVGAYALVIMSVELPNTLIAVRKSSPLVIGVGQGEFFIASDASPIIEYTNQVVYVNDYEMAIMQDNTLSMRDMKNTLVTPYIQELDMALEAIEKGGFQHFMLKEIFEQPKSMQDCMRGRVDVARQAIKLGGIQASIEKLAAASKITLVACGSSWVAGLLAEYWIEEFCRIPVEVEYASEFRYRNPIIGKGDMVLAISQSGETADTLAAVALAQERGATVLSICNVVGSSIARATQAGIYTHAGPEIGVASTKAFTAQLTVLIMLALELGRQRKTINPTILGELIEELASLPTKIELILQEHAKIQKVVRFFNTATNCLYLGRGYNYPVALEGALKLKELSYIHAEGYPAAEMKHGPIALIDEAMPVVFIATQDKSYEKIISNIQEIKARKGKIIAVVTQGDERVSALADHVIEVPNTYDALMPIVSVIPLQLLAYYMAVERGCSVDQPRNLAKSVTVE